MSVRRGLTLVPEAQTLSGGKAELGAVLRDLSRAPEAPVPPATVLSKANAPSLLDEKGEAGIVHQDQTRVLEVRDLSSDE